MTIGLGGLHVPLRLFNTSSRTKQEIDISGEEVTIYACGITPYSPSHIGHARQAIAFDTLVRWLRFQGVSVRYVTNFTDISDTIIDASIREGVDFLEVANRHISDYKISMSKLNVVDADAYPRVTESIDGIISMIETLIEKGHAYLAEDGVYFEIDTAPEKYGRLTGQTLEMVRSGAGGRVASTGAGKKDHRDFALWKIAKPGEPSWDSPFGKGRPGWHIECSAMVHEHFGHQVDIHGGGSDLMFPHHEAEIFQSECCFDVEPFAKHWMHNGMINVDGEKMSKSLGNFWTISDAIDAVGPLVLRYALVNAPYRQPIDFNQVLLDDAKKNHGKLIESIISAGGMGEASHWNDIESLTNAENSLIRGMEDDLNTRVAIAEMQSVVKILRQANSTQDSILVSACLGWLSAYAGEVLGLLPDGKSLQKMIGSVSERQDEIKDKVEALIKLREKARSERNWQEADKIRDEISELGVVIEDADSGPTWRIADP